MTQQLNAQLFSNGKLVLEFEPVEEQIGARRRSLEKKIHEFCRDDLLAALFYLVAFSCKRRGFCPSCGARHMVDSAALLVDEVLPRAGFT